MKRFIICFCASIIFISCNQKKKSTKSEGFEEQETELREYSHDLIKVPNPLPNSKVSSTIKIEGQAKGVWFFEATAPVELVTEDNILLAEGYIEATEPWMTEDFVPFEGELQVDFQEDEQVYLIFHKANASGLPEHDDEFRIPLQLKAD